MASTLSCSLSAPIRASSGSAPFTRKPDPSRIKPTWWSPLFGWSSDPDYLNNSNAGDPSASKLEIRGADPEPGRPRSRFSLGCFTEEKAKQLRRKTMEGASFHDAMYHSAIASRLASNISGWSDE